ncbi:hypothetical protein LRR18_18195, partial [Mangrovimonas sp. AS39]|uniref:hypothetical protein n=1 Tax=Mangrovimonas futianensis TaxID=2895523 RepID=UPI001E37BAC5
MTETVIGTSLDHYQEGLVKVASAIACRMPLVWVITNEERRFCEDLYDLCNSVKSQVHPDNLWVAAQL